MNCKMLIMSYMKKSMIIAKELAKTKKEKGILNDKIDILSHDVIKMRQVQIRFGSF